MRNPLLLNFLWLLLLVGCWSNDKKKIQPDVKITPIEDREAQPQFNPKEKRYAWQKPHLVIDKLGDIEGKVIADIGAGTGYFTFRLYQRSAKVIAVEIDPYMINLIEIFRANLDSVDQRKIETRLETATDPKLNKNEVDSAIIINTIGYIEDRSAYLSHLHQALKSNGEVMIVDYKLKRIPDNIAPPIQYRVNILELENILTEAGFTDIEIDDRSLDYQYIVKAKRK